MSGRRPADDSTLETLLHELRQIEGCERTKAAAIRVIASHAGSRLYIARYQTEHVVQRREARRMLDAGLPRPEIVRRLCKKFGFSESTAYRRVGQALDQGR